MMGFISSFESMAYGILGSAAHGSVGQQSRQRTHVIRQTSRGSIDKLIVALREARTERDRQKRRADALQQEVDRYRLMLARPHR